MDRVGESVHELVAALGLQGRAAAIEAEASSLLAVHDGIVEAEALAKQRPENKALAACYIAANYLLLPERVSYEAMCKAAAQTSAWRAEPAPSKNGITKLVKRFARRICPVEHEPEIVDRGGMVFVVCTQCHYVLRTGGRAGLATGIEGSTAEPEPDTRKGGLHASTDSRDSFGPVEPDESATPVTVRIEPAAEPAAPEPELVREPAIPEPETAEQAPESDATAGGTGGEEATSAPFTGVTPDIQKKWLASAAVHAKKYAKQFPALKPAVPGAVALLNRSIGAYITSDKVQGSLVQKLTRMALLHEAKASDIPVTSKELGVQPSDYISFLAASGASSVPVSTADDAALVEQALKTIAEYTGSPADDVTRARIAKFQTVTRRKLMGFSPGIASGILAFIDIARHDPGVMLAKVASAGGNNNSSLHNATNRFLDKVGRAGDPNAPLADRVRAAFPPRE